MGSIGGFQKIEKDGKLIFVYHHPKYHPIPQTQSLTSSDEAASHDHPSKPLFSCPIARILKEFRGYIISPVNSSPEYVVYPIRAQETMDHSVLPLFWCNNKKFDVDGGCDLCSDSNFGTDYYFCAYCDKTFHKECVQSPAKIKHPYHPQHSLQLSYLSESPFNVQCLSCGRGARDLVYYCTKCNDIMQLMHTECVMKPIPFVVEQPKSHDHPLTLFPRQASLTCNVCGLVRKLCPTYVCLECTFVAHNDCMYSPHIIKISRHHHRINYTPSLRSEEWVCGVCRKSIDCDYGAYTCDKCSDYAVHSRCALEKDVWDGKYLEGVPEKDDATNDIESFERTSDGMILHFLHDHHLQLEVSIVYDENKLCQACILPIFKGSYYSCMECEFVLHKTCAKAHRIIQYALHPHPLALKIDCGYRSGIFSCNACDRFGGGFVYQCPIRECEFDLDIRCASISEPFDYIAHEHLLFLALDPIEKPICVICYKKCLKQLNCVICDFNVCMKCATLPYEARYQHDKHFFKVLLGEACEKDWWCEVCERNLKDTETSVFYWCNVCCTTIHIECLLGEDPYIKPGQIFKVNGKEVQILCQNYVSRPLCDSCKNPCQRKILKRGNLTACSVKCGYATFM